MATHEPHEVLRIPVPTGPRDHETAAFPQRPEQLPYGDVEAVGGLLQDGFVPRETERLVLPREPVDDGAVLDLDAFRLSRGARRVEHVGEVVAAHHDRRPRHRRGERSQIEGLRAPEVVVLRDENESDAGVLRHEREPRRRQLGLEGHVGRARLEDAEQANQEVPRSIERNADRLTTNDAPLEERVRDRVGTRVELRVGERATVVDHGRRARVLVDVSLECGRDVLVEQVRAACARPFRREAAAILAANER